MIQVFISRLSGDPMFFQTNHCAFFPSEKRQGMPMTSGCSPNFTNASCCQPFSDPSESCRVQKSQVGFCYCDGLCFERGDCCNDIDTIEVKACVPCEGIVCAALQKLFAHTAILECHVTMSSELRACDGISFAYKQLLAVTLLTSFVKKSKHCIQFIVCISKSHHFSMMDFLLPC